ncbi:ferritin [Nocardia tenerifensis]|uniref:Ferritin n=1 Tax=Nocardia tenerifensis TaxID=228006 RepID=A0A318K3H5_9NOCA|nr:ferritin [Nocardia tenerifensis]PXX63024.1 ferritin [Nocardia tenerifensis]
MTDSELDQPFPALLSAQIQHGLTAAQQYLAAAVYLDSNRLPQLAKHCYAKSGEQRAHALRMVQYLLDRDLPVHIGGLDEIRSAFETPRAAIAFLLETEQHRTAQITGLARAARESGDYLGERFIQWFLEEQVDDVARMTTLLTVIDRSTDNLFDVENFIARELRTPQRTDNSTPRMAGAAKN